MCPIRASLGAERAINYKAQSFAAEIKVATGGRGADVILDMVGGDYVKVNIACAAEDGRIVQIAFLNGPKVEVNLMPVMLVLRHAHRIDPAAEKPRIQGAPRQRA